jgi:hypothetical protein
MKLITREREFLVVMIASPTITLEICNCKIIHTAPIPFKKV